jgi:hypothetical protein
MQIEIFRSSFIEKLSHDGKTCTTIVAAENDITFVYDDGSEEKETSLVNVFPVQVLSIKKEFILQLLIALKTNSENIVNCKLNGSEITFTTTMRTS